MLAAPPVLQLGQLLDWRGALKHDYILSSPHALAVLTTRALLRVFCVLLLRVAKDVDVAMRMVEGGGTAAPVLRLVRELVQVAKHELGGDADHTEMCKLLERWGGEGTEIIPRE